MSTRECIGAVGQWGVPHCDVCGSALGFWGPDNFDCVLGEVFVWMCRRCVTPSGAWELVTETGYPIVAYKIQPWYEDAEVWDWLRAGWRK